MSNWIKEELNQISFAPIKGGLDKHTFICKGTKVIGYYDYSWGRLGGNQYRATVNGSNFRANTRKQIESEIRNKLN